MRVNFIDMQINVLNINLYYNKFSILKCLMNISRLSMVKANVPMKHSVTTKVLGTLAFFNHAGYNLLFGTIYYIIIQKIKM